MNLPELLKIAEAVKFTETHIDYVRHYGGSCRDCADENGICPSSGLPCANSAKAIKHVLDALEYGINHGYAPPIAVLPSETLADAARYRWIRDVQKAEPQGAEFWPGIRLNNMTRDQDDEWCQAIFLDEAIDAAMNGGKE